MSLRWSHGVSVVLVGFLGAGCSTWAQVEVKASDCINPRTGSCNSVTGTEVSRVLEVRLYQLKQAVEPCQLNVQDFVTGRDFEVLKSALSDSQRSDVLRWIFRVEPKDARVLPRWELLKDTEYVLAVAIGTERGKNSIRLLSTARARASGSLPVLNFRGFDICLDKPCEVSLEAQCP
ncbi:hypothetical protein [Haliangium sp. UPWRP_2]|uniref:hypothetical protein n=1 Tax=Haliangium sp. UPWRP_2 TaxID=1931276 RepID=UPI0011B240BB|nr:hypothetical protein [Haliangium sp. UPWRP_2]PSM31804.1 hypothetical protein BVG81_003515 [Haliangium sp. UPWRP_2]